MKFTTKKCAVLTSKIDKLFISIGIIPAHDFSKVQVYLLRFFGGEEKGGVDGL